jgi:ornithine decarboxylase
MVDIRASEIDSIVRSGAGHASFASIDSVVATLKPAETVHCIYPGILRSVAEAFIAGFSGHVLYAVKANPRPEVIQELWAAGIRHFDTASLREIALVKSLFPHAECYFMAICKLAGAAAEAYSRFGVRHFVADHDSEVDRLLGICGPETTLHIRMKAFDPASIYELSSKFGAEGQDVVRMLRRVCDSGLRPGLAFNVGSLCRHPDAYRRAIGAAGDIARTSGVRLASLDIGGGFPTEYPGLGARPIAEFLSSIREDLAAAGLPGNCQVLCEPGRALVAAGQSILVQVILMKDDLVFLSDGIYGNFKELDISNGAVALPPRVIRLDGTAAAETRPYSISGPTCDSLDVFPTKLHLPADLRVGDWIEFGLAGAYTNSMSTRFNGLYSDRWVRIDGDRATPPGTTGESPFTHETAPDKSRERR